MNDRRTVAVIDAGGTKTRLCTARVDRGGLVTESLLERTIGPGNFRRVGVAGVSHIISELIELAELPFLPGDRILACFAGAGSDESRRAVEEVFGSRGFSPAQVEVISDAELLLRAIGDEGAVVIAGTGSICLGRKRAPGGAGHEYARSGGYGYLVHSDFSGFGIGIGLLREVLSVEDGRNRAASPLCSAASKALGVEPPLTSRITDILYPAEGQEIAHERVAALAPLVFEAAAAGDPIGRQLMARAASDLIQHVVAVTSSLGLTAPSIALHGGLFKHSHADELLTAPLREAGADLAISTIGVKDGDINPLAVALETLSRLP